MKELVLEAIEQFSLFEENKNITVALSGGADSMSLLYVLLSLKQELGIEVSAAHFNHLIRGEEALRDELFVKEYCEKLGVKLFCERADVPEYAKQNGMGVELAARTLRYEFLERVSTGLVATAHTASDNLETMLFNLARGTAVRGLCGIPPKRDIFIRPLLFCTRDDIERYCKNNNIPFVTDSTNNSDLYTRNKIRHKVVPILKEVNSAVERSAIKTAVALREDNNFLENAAKEYLAKNICENSLRLEKFSELEPAVAKRVIIGFTELVKPEIQLEAVHIKAILEIAKTFGETSIPCDCSAVAKNGVLRIAEKNQKLEFKVTITEQNRNFDENSENVNNLFLKCLLDCDKIVGKWILRTRRPGDSVRIKNRGCTKTLNRLLSEAGIPKQLRDSIPVISDEKGIVWVYKIGVAQRCAVTNVTKRIYKIDVKEIGVE